MSAVVAMLSVDRDGIVRTWDEGAQTLLGYSAEDAVGRAMDFFIPQEERAGHWAGFRAAMQRGVLDYGPDDVLDAEALSSDGARIAVGIVLRPLRDEAGRLAGIAACMMATAR